MRRHFADNACVGIIIHCVRVIRFKRQAEACRTLGVLYALVNGGIELVPDASGDSRTAGSFVSHDRG